ncbi:MAG TPA: hypothetical protein VFQ61_25855 [Polyangiaceae bacterium]|nr:hypothetical protein [Polyangiaceae bacterium]
MMLSTRLLTASVAIVALACSSGTQTLAWEGEGQGSAGSPGIVDPAFPEDLLEPWHGGPSYYGKWPRGLWTDTAHFPIGVWMQNPDNAQRFRDVGINLFLGLWEGPTDEQLAGLLEQGVRTICDQKGVWQSHLEDSTIAAWMSEWGPDNAQERAGEGYDPCIPPSDVTATIREIAARDATRPVLLGFGRGLADPEWVGRGECTGRTDMYPEYAREADVVGFHSYPVNSSQQLLLVAQGVDNLREYTDHRKPVFALLEAASIDGKVRPTPEQIRAMVWMVLIHGAAGIHYYCHHYADPFNETDCLDDAPTASTIASLNRLIGQLAPVLNRPTVTNGVMVRLVNSGNRVDVMLKRQADATYLFAVEMLGRATSVTFELQRFPAAAQAQVLESERSLDVTNGVFIDQLPAYGVRVYRVVPR